MDDKDRALSETLDAHNESITELERVTGEVLEKFEELRDGQRTLEDGQRALEARASKHSGEMVAIRSELEHMRKSQEQNFQTILTQLRRLTPIPPK